MDKPETTLTNGKPVTPDHREIDPRTGMQKAYVVLSEAERAKGFVRPVRDTYRHVGKRPQHPVRPLTPEEETLHEDEGYVLYETYPEDTLNALGGRALGRFWTEAELNSGCGATTTMGRSLAETYARQPGFYSGTYCSRCQGHFPVGRSGEFVWEGTDERVGT